MGSCPCHQLLGQAALADPRLADQQEQAPTAGEGVIETADQLSQLGIATHKRLAWGLHRRVGRHQLGCRQLKLRVLREYRPLEPAEPLARLDPELLDQSPARLLVGLQRVRLAVRPVQGQHQLRPRALSVGVVADQRLELPHHLGMTTERQLRLDQLLQPRRAQVVEPSDLPLREGLVGELR